MVGAPKDLYVPHGTSACAGSFRLGRLVWAVGEHGDEKLDGDGEHQAKARTTSATPKFRSVADAQTMRKSPSDEYLDATAQFIHGNGVASISR